MTSRGTHPAILCLALSTACSASGLLADAMPGVKSDPLYASPETEALAPAETGGTEAAGLTTGPDLPPPVRAIDASLRGAMARDGRARAEVGDLVREALERNPGVSAARLDWEAKLERPVQAWALEDPMLAYTRFLSTPETRVGPQRQSVVLSRKIPGGSKRRLRSEVASHEAQAAEQRYRAMLREVALRVRDAYYDYYFVVETVRITRESLGLLSGMENVARVRYSTGQAEQESVLKAQVELSKLNEKLLELARQEQVLRIRLNTLRDRPPATALAGPSVPRKLRGFDVPLAELEALARANREEIAAADAMVARARSALGLAEEAWGPDFTVGVGWVGVSEGGSMFPDRGKDAASVTVGVNLPWFNEDRIRAGVEESRLQLEAETWRRGSAENDALFDVGQAYFRIEASQRTVRLYDDSLLPQGRQALDAAAAGYPTGLVSFLDYLDAWRTLLGLRLGYYRAVADYYKGLAALERATGSDLE